MSEKRFNLSNPISHNPIPSWVNIIHDDMRHKHLNAEEIVDVLNEQQDTISALKEENEQLRQELQKKQEEEHLYANEILELREANKEFLQFKELGGDY